MPIPCKSIARSGSSSFATTSALLLLFALAPLRNCPVKLLVLLLVFVQLGLFFECVEQLSLSQTI